MGAGRRSAGTDSAAVGQGIRVVLVAGYRLLLEALTASLNSSRDLVVVGQSDSLIRSVELLRELRPDVMLLELTASPVDELDVITRVVSASKTTRVLILAMETSDQLAVRMLRTGAHGIVSRNKSTADLIEAIHKVHRGELYLTPELQRLWAVRYLDSGVEGSPEKQLSNREYQVLRLLASGDTNREIADKLGIGVKTVDTHRANLLRKLNLRNNSDLTRFAIKKGLIELNE